jgi:hypothetical protein
MGTKRGYYRFIVKESERGLFLVAEPAGDVLTGLDGLLGFDLEEGTSMEEAMHIAHLMNDKLTSVTLTK